MWRDDAYVLDMLLAARKVLEFTADIGWERFQRDDLVQNAVMRQIQIIVKPLVRYRRNTKGIIRRCPGATSWGCGTGSSIIDARVV